MLVNYLERYSKLILEPRTPIMIEVQINGARKRAANPHLPITHEEIADEVLRVAAAGASIIHAHNTNFMLHGEAAYDDYMKSWQPILEARPDILWYCTTTIDEDRSHMGLEHAELLIERAGMRLGCVDPGAANVAHAQDEQGQLSGRTYMWTLDQINRQVAMFNRHQVGIVFGIYEPGFLRTALHYYWRGLIPAGSQIDLYLFGDYGPGAATPVNTLGLPPTEESLYFYLNMLEGCDLPWFVSIWGAGDMDLKPLMRRVAELGGHLKVGLESHFDPQRKPTNLELLREAQEVASQAGRAVATPHQAAAILGLHAKPLTIHARTHGNPNACA